jgi:STE24 endopeptidase
VPPQLPRLPGIVRKVKPLAWVELAIALPWLWWSWLSIQFLGVPNRALYWVGLAVWAASAVVLVTHPRPEVLLARTVYRQRIGPAWWAVCTAAGVNPDHYRVWVHEGPEATAPATAGSTVTVTSWAVYRLPPQHLEAVLARELAQRLAISRTPSLLLYWLTVPARMMGRAIVFCLRHRVLSILAKIVIGFLLIGVLGVWVFLGFSHYVVFMLSLFLTPFVVPWAARTQERLADRAAAGLGYGVLLAEVFTGREFERAQQWQAALHLDLKGSQQADSTRLRALENYLNSSPARRPL